MKKEYLPALIKKWILLVLIAGMGCLLVLIAYFSYLYEAQSLREIKHDEIQAVAEMKIHQIAQWRKERIADAAVVSQSPLLAEKAGRWIGTRNNRALENEIETLLVPARYEYEYGDIFLASPKGECLLSFEHHENSFNTILTSKIMEAVQRQQITLTDFYYCALHQKIHFDIIAPICDAKGRSVAALIFRVIPDAYLYPLIQSWPTPSKTSETLLIKKDGDSVLFLNDLRQRKHAALNLRIPLTRTDNPAVQAVLGTRGVFQGNDYNGNEVLSYVSEIPNSPWFMVAKIDTNEVYTELRFRAILISLCTIILIILLGVGMALVYNNRQKNIYLELFIKEKELRANQQEFKTTLYSIGDAVMTIDALGTIRHMNPVAEQLTGWKEADSQGMQSEKVFTIVHEDSRTSIDHPIQRVLQGGTMSGLANHTMLVAKDGKEIPIADTVAPIKTESGEITGVVLVFRDQTEERGARKKLVASESRYRGLFENMLNGFAYCKMLSEDGSPADFIYLNVNKAFETLTGLKNVTGKKVSEVIPGIRESDPELLKRYGRVAQSGIPEHFELFVDALTMWFSISVYSPEREYFIAVFDVITNRKLAEEALLESEKKFRNLFEYSPIGISMTGIDGSLHVNKTFCSILGYTEDNLKKMKWMEITHPDDLHRSTKISQTLLDGEISQARFEKKYIHQNGSTLWADVSMYLQRDSKNTPLYFITIISDITDRKRAEENVRRFTEELGQLVEERTAELNTTVAQLQEQNRVFVGRELRMVELKEQIADLERKTGGKE